MITSALSIRRFSLSWCCRSPNEKFPVHWKQLFAAFLPITERSLSRQVLWQPFWYCLSLFGLCGHRRRGQRSCWCHSKWWMIYPTFLVSEFRGDAVKKLFKINFSAHRFKLTDHIEDGGVFALEAETLHGGLELTWVNFASGFSVEEVESFSEFFNLVLSESWPFHLLLGSTLHWNTLLHLII